MGGVNVLVVDYVNNKVYYASVTYRVIPVTRADCDCPDCRAGKHLYELHCWQDGQWRFVGVSLQSYGSAEDCKQHHYWGIEFQADDVWENETSILPPESIGQAHPDKPKSGTGRRVTLDQKAFVKSAEALEQHWLR